MSEAHVRKIYWVNLAVSVFVVLPLTIVLPRPVIPESFAFGAGALMTSLTGFPFNRELARRSGQELTKRPRKTGQVVEVEAVW